MGEIDRRQLLRGSVAAGVAAAFSLRGRDTRADAIACPPLAHATPAIAYSELANKTSADRFLRWLRTDGVSHQQPVENLVHNFVDATTRAGTWIYPMLCGKTMLWFARRGQFGEAAAIAETLLDWQQLSADGKHARSYGAFPSQIDLAPDGTWKAADYYYSADNLVILDALLAVHAATKNAALLNAAIGIGTWLTEVMCKGHTLGMWTEDHGAPMFMVRGSGDFANEIHAAGEMLWIGALHRLGTATNEQAYCRQAERALKFYLGGQLQSGAFLDHYDPGYPPKPYDAGRWAPVHPGQIIADSFLRSVLGACKWGELARARKAFEWLKTEAGAVPAYLSLETGSSGFPKGQNTYYDLTSSALHRTVAQWLGERAAAVADQQLLDKLQHSSGGWYWGVFKNGFAPVDNRLAPIVGLWATADLSIEVE